MKLLRFHVGTWKILVGYTSIISFGVDVFNKCTDDLVLRMLVLTKPFFIENMPMEDILTPLNPMWFMKAAIWKMQN